MITKTRKKRSYQSLLASIFIGILTLGLIGFLVVSNWRINQRKSELMSRIESLKNEIQTLEEEKAKLQAKIDYIPLEEGARDKLGLKKPGEEVVSIKQEQNEEEVKQEEKKSFWQKIWEKLNL